MSSAESKTHEIEASDETTADLANASSVDSFLRAAAHISEVRVAGVGVEPDRQGRLIAGRYRLHAPLGGGAHGEVWEADDALAGERVAIKLLKPRANAHAARIRREVAALRLLRLPGVVRLLDEGVDEGRAFLVMERVAGLPFPGRFTPCDWAQIEGAAVALLESLARVHAAGVIHRDLKPANILVSAEGQPTILDFGLSHFGSPTGEGLTEEGQMLGTPAFLAPEQISGGPVTPRTDLYAIGVIFYAALAGRLPHEAKDIGGLLRARLTQRPAPLKDVAPSVPLSVAAAIDQLLSIEASSRPRSAAEALERLRGQRATTSPLLRRLGLADPAAALVAAAARGMAIDLHGPRGSGRTRCLEDAAKALREKGVRVIFTVPARAPFASLEPIVGALDVYTSKSLSEVVVAVDHRLSAVLVDGAALFVDDVERIDRASAAAIERCRRRGFVVRAIATKADAAPADVRLAALDEAALRPLFAGPDRLLHLREDAARALFTRTEGLPARVIHEVHAWARAGLARWDGELLVIDRDAIERLEAGLRVAPPLALDADGGALDPLPPRLDDLLTWVAIAWPHGDLDLLSAAMKEPRWRLEAELDDLAARGAVLLSPEGHLLPRRAPCTDEVWSPERRQAAHLAIAEAQRPGAPGRLLHLLAGAGDTSDPIAARAEAATARSIAREAFELAGRLAREGRLGRATLPLGEGLRALRRLSPVPAHDVEPLLALWVEVALSDGTPQALDRVLYELCRTDPRTDLLAHLEALVRAALAVGVWTERALVMASAVPPFVDPPLELRRQGVRVLASRRGSRDREEAVLAEVATWIEAEASSDPAARASLAGWRGHLCYRQGRFDEAAALTSEAAEGEAWVGARILARLNGASARMEGFDHVEAAAWAAEAQGLARTCRNPYFEGRAEWLLRCIAYRTGRASTPDSDLVEASARVGVPELEGLVCMNEAAVAWRAADLPAALALAERAYRRLAPTGEPLVALLVGSLMIACGATLPATEVSALVERALHCLVPGVGIQALGLFAPSGLLPAWPGEEAIASLAALVPERFWDQRMEVLSVQESLSLLKHPS